MVTEIDQGTLKFKHLTMLGARVCFLTVLLLSASLIGIFRIIDFTDALKYIYYLVGILFSLCAASGLYLRFFEPGTLFFPLHALFDIVIATTVIYLTGGPTSQYLYIYLPLVVGVAMIFSWQKAALVGIGCIISYWLMGLSMILGYVNTITGQNLSDTHFIDLIVQSFALLFITVFIVALSYFLSKKLNQTYSLVEQSQQNLSALTDKYNTELSKLQGAEERLEIQERMVRILAGEEKYDTDIIRPFPEFIGESEPLKKVFEIIEKVANADSSVLVTGESGTGKELVARSIHSRSLRNDKPFVPVNCGAIPENLVESEFFGYKKGSFTGAVQDAPGLFKLASGGTLFLDEVGELPLLMQAKLLRVLQERKVRAVGGDREQEVDVRVIAATNKDLEKEVRKGTFREDLYYRIHVIQISMPSLRERKEDIPLLVDAFIKKFKPYNNPVISPKALHLLMQYNYSGNIRELENIIERALVLGGEVLLPEHLPEGLQSRDRNYLNFIEDQNLTQIIEVDSVEFPVKLDEILSAIEKRYLFLALKRSNGVRKRASDLLGINFRSLRYRLAKFGIHDNDER